MDSNTCDVMKSKSKLLAFRRWPCTLTMRLMLVHTQLFFCVFAFTILSPIFFYYFFLNKPVFVHSVVWLKFMLRLMTAFSRRNQLQTRVSIANRSALTPALQVWVFYVASMAFNPTSNLLLQSSIEKILHMFVEH